MKILNRFTGEVIFEAEALSMKDLVVRAIENNISLRNANLYNVNLCGANLYGADLRNANLYGVSLRNADLHNAILCDADLHNATLCDTDLCGADLRGAKNIHSFQCGEYNRVCYAVKHETKVMFQIGCFWGDKYEVIKRIRAKYGKKSSYEKLIKIYDKMLKDQSY